mgnify:CR=1 FL=1
MAENFTKEDDKINDRKGDFLINDLLQRCEVTNLPGVYKKYLEKKDHICRFSEMMEFNGYFTDQNIRRDLEKIPEIIEISVFPDFFDRNLDAEQNHAFETVRVLTDESGLASILKKYRKMKFIDKITNINDLCEIFGIKRSDKTNRLKLIQLIRQIVNHNRIYAIIHKAGDRGVSNVASIKFVNKFLHPKNRILLYELIATVFIGVILLVIILNLVSKMGL